VRMLIACCLCIALSSVAADKGYHVTFNGGSLPGTKAGTGLMMYIDQNQVWFVKDKETIITIPSTRDQLRPGRTPACRYGHWDSCGFARHRCFDGTEQIEETLRRSHLGELRSEGWTRDTV